MPVSRAVVTPRPSTFLVVVASLCTVLFGPRSATAADLSHLFVNASSSVAPYTSAAGTGDASSSSFNCPAGRGTTPPPRTPIDSWTATLANEALGKRPDFVGTLKQNIDQAVHTGFDGYVSATGKTPEGFTTADAAASFLRGRVFDVLGSQSFWASVTQYANQVPTPGGVDPEAFLGWMNDEAYGLANVCDDPAGNDDRLWVAPNALFWQSGPQWAKVQLPAGVTVPPRNATYLPIPHQPGAYAVFTNSGSYLPTVDPYGILRLGDANGPRVDHHSCDPLEPSTQTVSGQLADTIYRVTRYTLSFVPGVVVPTYLPDCDTVDATLTRVTGPTVNVTNLQVSNNARYIAAWTYAAGSGDSRRPAIARFELSADGRSYGNPIVVGTGLPLDLGYNGSPALTMSDDGSTVAMCNAGPGGISGDGDGPAGTVRYPLLVHVDDGTYGWPRNGVTDLSQCSAPSLDRTGDNLWWRQTDGWWKARTLLPDSVPVPTIAVTGVTDGATYDAASAPAAGCAVTDPVQPSASATPLVSGPTGPRAFAGLGDVTVRCSWTDVLDRTVTATVRYSLVDDTAPAVGTKADIVADATSAEGATVAYAAPAATDTVDGSVPVTCAPASGSAFPLAATTVHCAATDQSGNTGRTSFSVTVRPGPLHHLVVAAADITAGQTTTPTASGRDEFGHSRGDLTADTTFTIAPVANGTGSSNGAACAATGCTAQKAGTYVITGTNSSATGQLTTGATAVTVGPAALHHLTITAADAVAGTAIPTTATGRDRYDNSTGNVTTDTTFAITPADGSTATADGATCTGATCTATRAGNYTVTGTNGPASGSTAITISAANPAIITPVSGTAQAAPTYQPFASPLVASVTDAYGNAVTAARVTFAVIADSAGGSAAFGGQSTATALSAANGVVTSPNLTAGSRSGPITVTGTLDGNATATTATAATAATTATASSSTTSATASWALTVTSSDPARADVSIAIVAPSQVARSGTATVRITVGNAGPQSASKIGTLFVAPSGWTIANAAGGRLLSRNSAIFTTSTLPVRGTATYSIIVTTSRTAGTGIFAAATLSATVDPTLRNNAALALSRVA